MDSIFAASSRRQLLSEVLGTYLLVAIGPGTVVLVSASRLPSTVGLLLVAFVFGAVVAGAIVALGWISGALINPAITLASATAGSISRRIVAPYIACQLLGALGAGLTLAVTFGALNPASLGSTKLASGVSPVEGLALETLGTFILASSALIAGSILDGSSLAQASLVGSTLFILIVLIGPLTGASFNPARSLGPSLFSDYFKNQLIYYVGPVAGGVLAGLAFTGAKRLAN